MTAAEWGKLVDSGKLWEGSVKQTLDAIIDDLAAMEKLAIGGEGETHFYYRDEWEAQRERAVKAELENYRAVWIEAAKQRDAIAAKLEEAEAERARLRERLIETASELREERDDLMAYYEAQRERSALPRPPHPLYAIIDRIETRRKP